MKATGNKPLTVIKIGGRSAEPEVLKALSKEISSLSGSYQFLLVHGGGADVSKVSEVFGLSPRFEDGIRMTAPEEMGVVDMVLAGKVNKDITRIFRTQGINALGLSGSDGGLFIGKALSDDSHTGKVTDVNKETLKALLDSGFLPVVSSTSMEISGKALNINADEAALALASAYPAKKLLFISDIPGVMSQKEEVLSRLDKAGVARAIEDEVVTGGMIPKVNSSIEALSQGVGAVIIGQYKGAGDLKALLDGHSGTQIQEG